MARFPHHKVHPTKPAVWSEAVQVCIRTPTTEKSMFDEKNVSITIRGGEYSFSSVSCSKPRSSDAVRELRKSMRVAVRGVITSEEMGIGLSRCKFWIFSEKRWVGVEPTTRVNSSQEKDETEQKSKNTENERKEERTISSLTERCAPI